MKLSIVIPARNEEACIARTIENIEKIVEIPHEIIVVDDHSQDRTGEIVDSLRNKYSNLSLVKNEDGPGFSSAIKKGFSVVKEGAVVLMMADFCDDPRTVEVMFEKIKEGYDVVCGSRYMKGGKKIGGRCLQNFFSRLVGLSLHFLKGIPTHDVSNAFKMYRREILDSINIEEAGFASSMEIVLKLYKKGYMITEVPTLWKGRTAGRSNFRLLKVARNYIYWYLWALFLRVDKKSG